MGATLPAPSVPKASYVMCVHQGRTLYLAGHLPAPLVTGKVGKDVSVEEANLAARSVALNLLATIKNEIGNLDRVSQVIKLTGFVNCVDGFSQQPQVRAPKKKATPATANAAHRSRGPATATALLSLPPPAGRERGV